MPFEELLLFFSGQSPTIAAIVVGAVVLYQQRDIKNSIRRLNHNSSTIVKALLARKVIRPEDIEDVEI